MRFYFPQKPTRITSESSVFKDCEEDSNYVAQKKKDGWRVQIHIENGEVTFFTRHNRRLEPIVAELDWNEMAKLFLDNVKCDSCIIDGEFLHRRTDKWKATFYVWDLFELNGERLRKPYRYRKHLLDRLVSPTPNLMISKDYYGNFIELWKSLDLSVDEGIVIKDLNEPLYVNFNKTINSPRQFKMLLDDPRNTI